METSTTPGDDSTYKAGRGSQFLNEEEREAAFKEAKKNFNIRTVLDQFVLRKE